MAASSPPTPLTNSTASFDYPLVLIQTKSDGDLNTLRCRAKRRQHSSNLGPDTRKPSFSPKVIGGPAGTAGSLRRTLQRSSHRIVQPQYQLEGSSTFSLDAVSVSAGVTGAGAGRF